MSHVPPMLPALVPLAISARHVHLTQGSLERLFGAGHVLTPHLALSQPGQFAARETVTLVGPRRSLPHVRIVGPLRSEDQVEISRTDEIELGLDAPLRESGDLKGTPGIAIEGPAGRIVLDHGVICPLRHIHMSPADAAVLGVADGDRVAAEVMRSGRRLRFSDVLVRVAPDFKLELHLDTDEGNAAGARPGDEVLLAEVTPCRV